MTSRPVAPAPPAPAPTPPAGDLRVDCERLKRDVLALGEIGRDPDDRGIYRMAFTDADMEGRRWLLGRLEEAGLAAWMDGAANVHGRLGDDGPASVLIGSHTDTVPRAGMLDGALGVVVGLEVLRTLREHGTPLARPIELISFADEEGRFGGMLGSEALAGLLTPESLHFTALDGAVLHEEMARHGLDPMGALDARRRPETVDCYLELHIEQGPVLERCGETVGVVEHITGLFKWLVRFHGEANHAGTTPMDMRRDAFLGLAELATELPRLLEENGSERARATIGRAQILPGAPNTVPGEVEFSLDVRDTSADGLAELAAALRKALAAIARRRGLIMDLEFQSEIAPVPCDPALVELLESLAVRSGVAHRRMPSGAAHDAQIVAGIAPMGMLFVPSRAGKSHTPEEWTDWDDVEAGANILLAAAATRAGMPGAR
jgi:N-carbamoyl-L-amino-acid hydrolase